MGTPQPYAVMNPLEPNKGVISNYKITEKGEVSFLWDPQQLMSIPRAELGQAGVIVMPVVMVVVRADQMAARGLLVMGDQVFVREPLEGQTQGTCYQLEEGIHLAVAGDRICPPRRSVVLMEGGGAHGSVPA